MKAAIIVSLFFLIFVGGAIAVIFYLLKKKIPTENDKTEQPNITTTQEFLPLIDISDDMIVLPNNRFRAVLACSSTNYRLKTAEEKDIIEISFQRFLNTITFPITFFLQTKIIDNTTRCSNLERELESTVFDFPEMKGMAEQYAKEMRSLNATLGNNRQKMRYIIISYDDAAALSNLTDREKRINAEKELKNRCLLVKSNLEAVGVSSYILNTDDLTELVYASYHRDSFSYAKQISSGNALSLLVDGKKDHFQALSGADLLKVILSETVSKIENSELYREPQGKNAIRTILGLLSDEQEGREAKNEPS